MKRISFTEISIGILVIIIILMAVIIGKKITENSKATAVLFSDNTPMADTPEPANEIEAIRIIAPENHMPDAYRSFYRAPEKQKFYQRQLKAIEYIRIHQIKAAIPLLILYLDYPTSAMEAGTKDYAHGPETGRAQKAWPAFGALSELSGSGEAVRDYCLDPVHPMRYRLAAFHVLQVIDQSLVEPCWASLKGEGQGTEFQGAFDEIKSGHAIFWGMQGEMNSQ